MRYPKSRLKPVPKGPDVEGLAAAAGKNREREARLRLVEAFRRLGTAISPWPPFVRAFSTDPQQQIVYQQRMTPPPFQPPEFDRLNESYQGWTTKADRAWALHRNAFVQECEAWVTAGVDEKIVEAKRVRGTGKRVSAHAKSRSRGENTPIDLRYEWAAKYLVNVPLKEIAGGDADPATVGRVAREILRLAGWGTAIRSQPARVRGGVPLS